MYLVIDRSFMFLQALIVALLLQGCFIMASSSGPGYVVEIRVVDDVKVRIQDIKHLEKLAIKQKYVQQKEVDLSRSEKGIYYGRILEGKEFKSISHRFINLIYSYSTENDSNHSEKTFQKFSVLIYNDWEGQRPPIKDEIDSFANLLFGELRDIVGTENVYINRKRTHPPF